MHAQTTHFRRPVPCQVNLPGEGQGRVVVSGLIQGETTVGVELTGLSSYYNYAILELQLQCSKLRQGLFFPFYVFTIIRA